jgi:hypothetical protein
MWIIFAGGGDKIEAHYGGLRSAHRGQILNGSMVTDTEDGVPIVSTPLLLALRRYLLAGAPAPAFFNGSAAVMPTTK